MLRSVVFLLALAAAPATALVAHPAGPGKPATNALRLRGGLGGVDADQVLKYATGVSVLNSVYIGLAPEKGAEAYGVAALPFTLWQMESLGHLLFATAILHANLLNGASLNNSIFWAQLAFLHGNLKNVFNDTSKKLGFASSFGGYFFLAMNLFLAHALHTEADYTDTAITAVCGFKILNSIIGFLSPKPTMKAWGIDVASDTDMWFTKAQMAMMAMFPSTIIAIQQGNDITKAIGISWALMAAIGIDTMFVSKWAEKVGAPLGPQYAWLGIQGAILAAVFL